MGLSAMLLTHVWLPTDALCLWRLLLYTVPPATRTNTHSSFNSLLKRSSSKELWTSWRLSRAVYKLGEKVVPRNGEQRLGLNNYER